MVRVEGGASTQQLAGHSRDQLTGSRKFPGWHHRTQCGLSHGQTHHYMERVDATASAGARNRTDQPGMDKGVN